MSSKGIVIAGNILSDIVKNIDIYPEPGMLANISSVSRAVGGCAPNTSINLAKIDGSIPLSVMGCVGRDEHAAYILECLKHYGIDIDGIRQSDRAPTSFSDVMNLPSGERTFFHARGANVEFSPEQIDMDALDCDIFHIGYVSLLDRFDENHGEYGTAMAEFLHRLQSKGIKTSIDTVSDLSPEFSHRMKSCLKYCDYVIINEIECCGIWGLDPRLESGKLNKDAIYSAMEKCILAGVREKVIVHCKEAGFCMSNNGSFSSVGSLKIPPEDMKGSVGAGDAFCAGALYSLYHGKSDNELLEFASAAAACNLFSENSVDGMRDHGAISQLMAAYPRKEI